MLSKFAPKQRHGRPGLGILVAVVGGILAVIFWPRSRPIETFTGRALGTNYAVTVVGKFKADAIGRVIELALARVDALLSNYRPDSDIGRLNQTSSTEWLPVAGDTVRVMQLATAIASRCNGGYDMTVGPLVNLWGFGPGRRPRSVPTLEEIARTKVRIGLDKIELRADPPAVRKLRSDVLVDLSSVGDGFGADAVGEALERLGIADYCVEVGGEVRARGRNGNGIPWQIALQVPDAEDRAVQRIVPLSGLSLATSGDYRNYFEENGTRYSHIIDPRTGHPIQNTLASVTVLDESCARADGWATALLVLGPDEGIQLAEREHLAALFIVRGKTGFEERSSSRFRMVVALKDPRTIIPTNTFSF